MAKLIYALNQSLDGYVDHQKFGPTPALFRHFIEEVRRQTGMVYGRGMYEVMRYWDDDFEDWGADEREYAAAWRSKPKWVVSRTLPSVGPNATLISDDVEAQLARIKAGHEGEIEIAGTVLAGNLGDSGLIDEYRIYLHPVILGGGTPFFTSARAPLRFLASELITGDVIRLAYAPV